MIIKETPKVIELKKPIIDKNVKSVEELRKINSSIEDKNTLKESMELLLI